MPFPFLSSPFLSPRKLALVQLQGQDRPWKPCGPGSSSEAFTPGCGFEPTFWSLVLFPSHTRGFALRLLLSSPGWCVLCTCPLVGLPRPCVPEDPDRADGPRRKALCAGTWLPSPEKPHGSWPGQPPSRLLSCYDPWKCACLSRECVMYEEAWR